MELELIILIDFMNVILTNKTNSKGKLAYYFLMRDKLMQKVPNAKIIPVVDAPARYRIDDKEQYEQLCKTDGFVQVPAGEEADYYLLEYARTNPHCLIISRDTFKNYSLDDSFKKRIIPFALINGEIILSPKFDEFLNTSV